MIIYGLLKLVIFILDMLGSIFGSMIPDLPSSLNNILTSLSTMINGGLSFISYFFYWPLVIVCISIFISFDAFKRVRSIVMKVIGHFIA